MSFIHFITQTFTSMIFLFRSHFFIELHGSLNKQDFLIILTYLRSAYDHCLKSGHTPNYSLFSKSGTLAGTLSEVKIIYVFLCGY